jgi:predicted deacylase
MAPGEIFDFEESSAPQFISAKTDSTGLINSGLRTITRPTVVPVLHDLDISSLPTGTVSKFSLVISPNALDTVNIPVFAYRSGRPGPIVGITCAIHGNEVNGIPVIQRLFADIEGGLKADDATIGSKKIFKVDCGTIIGIPVVNVPGFLTSNRCFDDESKQDLNRLMPGYKNLYFAVLNANNIVASLMEQRLNNMHTQYSIK